MGKPNQNVWPEDLVACAEFEIHTFERPSSKTSEQLLAEVKAWRARFPEYCYRTQDDCVALK